VFSNSPCRETPKNALKKKRGTGVLFCERRRCTSVSRFFLVFFLPPLGTRCYTYTGGRGPPVSFFWRPFSPWSLVVVVLCVLCCWKSKGRRRKRKLKATYIWQMATKVGRYFFLFFFNFVYGIFVRFSTRGVQKRHKKLMGKVHVKNFWPKKLRFFFFPFVFSHRFFNRFFLAVSLLEEPITT
jgi:hypothetical protein